MTGRTVASAGDLVDWWSDPTRRGWTHPHAAGGTDTGVRVYFMPPTGPSGRGAKARPARPPAARLVGPHVATIPLTAAQLLAEAAYLTAAAGILGAVEAGFDPTDGSVGLPPPSPDTIPLPFGTTIDRPTVEVAAP